MSLPHHHLTASTTLEAEHNERHCWATDDRIIIRWAESILYGPEGAPSSDPRFTFAYDARVHDRAEFWREDEEEEEGYSRNPESSPPIEPYERGSGFHIITLRGGIHYWVAFA